MIKEARYSGQEHFPDRGLYVNAEEFRDNLEALLRIALGRREGLPKGGVANMDTVTTIPKQVLSARIAALDPAKLLAIDRALRFALGLV